MRAGALRTPLGVAIAAVVAMLAALAFAGNANAATQTWTGPNILKHNLQINGPGAPGFPIAAGVIDFEVDGEQFAGLCVDISFPFKTTPTEVTVGDAPAGVHPADARALAWILANKLPTPGATGAEDAAAAAQIAAWILVDGTDIDVTDPTGDTDLNNAAIALIAEARAATSTPASLGMSASTPAAGERTATLTITGRPGATVVLTLTSGAGSLSTNSVTLDASGNGTALLTTTGAGTVTVAANTAGDAELLWISPTSGKDQDTAAARPSALDTSVSVTFTNTPPTPPTPPVTPPTPPVTPPVTPPTPSVPPATPPTVAPPPGTAQGTPAQVTRRAVLRITKTGPKRARGNSRVVYRIVVRNTGNGVARNVVIRDHLPKGLAHIRSPKGTFRKGVVTFRLGNLRPGARKVVRVIVKAPSNARGRKLNVATVRATGLRPVRDTAPTVFRPLIVRVSPAVTG